MNLDQSNKAISMQAIIRPNQFQQSVQNVFGWNNDKENGREKIYNKEGIPNKMNSFSNPIESNGLRYGRMACICDIRY